MCKSNLESAKILESAFVCGCFVGLESAQYPVLKTKNSKTFKCCFCGKVYKTENFKMKTYSLSVPSKEDQVFVSKIISEYTIKADWKCDEYVVIESFNHQVKNTNLDLFLVK